MRLLTYALCAACWPALLVQRSDAQERTDLPRRAIVGIDAAPSPDFNGLLQVRGTSPETTGSALGLRPGDVILRIDGDRIDDLTRYARAVRRWRAGRVASVDVVRGRDTVTLQHAAVAFPRENEAGIESRYTSVVTEFGDRVRLLVTRPAGASGRLPAIVFVPWLSCSSVELSIPTSLIGVRSVIFGLTRAGYAVWRVEKPGVGDSDGPDCSELDYDREVAAYRAGYREAVRASDVDSSAVFLFGHSLGGSIAPQLALERAPAGIVVAGTYARSWFEHAVGFERRRLQHAGRAPAAIDAEIRALSLFYSKYLLEERTPQEIVRQHPELAAVWYDGPYHQFGRPVRFYHQVQRARVATAWERLSVPALVLFGEYDTSMSREDHELIRDIVNRRAPELARFQVLPKTDHSLVLYDSFEQALQQRGGAPSPATLDAIRSWLGAIRGR